MGRQSQMSESEKQAERKMTDKTQTTLWQPINTAKKRKRPILSYCIPVDDPYDRPAEMAVIWWGSEDGCLPDWQGRPTVWHKPTHWMELPDAP